MNNCEVKPVNESYNQEMLSIVAKSPIHGNGMKICFDKSPDIFAISRMKFSQSKHLGFFEGGVLKGFGSLGFFEANVQGRNENVFTVYNFYILPEARGRKFPQLAMKEFISMIGDKANYGIGITMKGNKPAESYIGRYIGDWMSPTRVIDDWVVNSILVAFPKKNETGYIVRNATIDDIPQMVELLNQEHRQRDFASTVSEEDFISNLGKRRLQIENYFLATDKTGRIKGVCLAWDCNSFRRTRVQHFSSGFYPYFIIYKMLGKVFQMAPLPAEGENFHELTITDYAVADRKPSIMNALLTEIYHRNRNRKYHFLTWGSCGADPLLKAVKGFWHKEIRSHIIFTSVDPERYFIETRLPYLDIAFF